MLEKVFEEFNSLSCIYGDPADTFVDQRPPYVSATSLTHSLTHALTPSFANFVSTHANMNSHDKLAAISSAVLVVSIFDFVNTASPPIHLLASPFTCP